MKVLKFGGTSLGGVERIKNLVHIISQEKEDVILVLSAMAGTTNSLVEISSLANQNKKSQAVKLLDDLFKKKKKVILDLFVSASYIEKVSSWLDELYVEMKAVLEADFTQLQEKFMLAQGEIISTQFVSLYLQELGEQAVLLSALDFMKIDENDSPDLNFIAQELKALMASQPKARYYITQGFICRNHLGEIDNLKRGGSDYTASLIGSALGVSEIQIWTDIDGMHNNDPRLVSETKPIRELTFNEAAELAYFGAKILHPSCILPAQKANVEVRLLSTLNPNAPGTSIRQNILDKNQLNKAKAVAAKENITAIRIHSTRMLLAYGFLRAVFEVFERYKTPIDMITTSEVAVSLTIDDTTYLEEIIQDLEEFGTLDVVHNQAIVCIVGDHIVENKDLLKNLFASLNDFPLRMISYGGSENNISFLTHQEHKVAILKSLNESLFNLKA